MKKLIFSGISIVSFLSLIIFFLLQNRVNRLTLIALSVLLIISLSALVTFIIFKFSGKKFQNSDFNKNDDEKTVKFLNDNVEIKSRQTDVLKQELFKLMDNYGDGILIFDEKGICVFSNKTAKNYLNMNNENLKYDEIIEDEKFNLLVLKAIRGEQDSAKTEINGKSIQCTSFILEGINNKFSSMISLKNITDSEKNENMRVEFSANVSHELKTPLTSIMGNAEIIETGIAKSDDIKNIATNIRLEAQRMLKLIDDVINISKLSDSEVKQSFEEVFIDEITKEVIKTLRYSARKKNIQINFESENLSLAGNRQVIYEMFYNLIDNAISYGKENGTVDIKVYKDSKGKHFRVSDDGIGIAKEDQQRIFERFYRVDKSHSKSTGGTGLGLSIVKHGSLMHGAKITLDSSLGVGTKIDICFQN